MKKRQIKKNWKDLVDFAEYFLKGKTSKKYKKQD